MKTIILSSAFLVCFSFCVAAQETADTKNNTSTLAQRMAAYEKGQMTIEQITDKPEWAKELLEYYEDHTNDVPVKWKLPISRCFAGFADFPSAEKVATEYVGAFPRDGRGWRIVGNSELMQRAYDKAIDPLTKAVKFGDDYSYKGLGGAALALGRTDLLKEIAPHLLQLRDLKEVVEKKEKLDVVLILVIYSLSAKDQDLFVKSLDGLTAREIAERKDLASYVSSGCEKFDDKRIKDLCGKLSAENPTGASEKSAVH